MFGEDYEPREQRKPHGCESLAMRFYGYQGPKDELDESSDSVPFEYRGSYEKLHLYRYGGKVPWGLMSGSPEDFRTPHSFDGTFIHEPMNEECAFRISDDPSPYVVNEALVFLACLPRKDKMIA